MTHHLLKLITSGLTATVGLNGAPILIDPNGIGLNATFPVNPWLKPKENTLSIFLALPLPAPEVKLPEIDVYAELYSVKPNSPQGEPDVYLARFERNAKDFTPLPVAREIPFVVTAPPPSNLWTEAARINGLSGSDQQQLRTLVQKFADALQRRDLDAISTLLEYKTKDCALANSQDPEEMRQVIRELYTDEMFTQPSYRVEGAQGNGLVFKLVAGGQMVWMSKA